MFGPVEPLGAWVRVVVAGDVALLFTADGTDLAMADACLRAASARRAEPAL